MSAPPSHILLLLTVAADIAGRFLYRINQIVTSYICIHMYHIVKVKENSNYSRKDKYYPISMYRYILKGNRKSSTLIIESLNFSLSTFLYLDAISLCVHFFIILPSLPRIFDFLSVVFFVSINFISIPPDSWCG